MSARFAGQTVLVTGGNSGIGLAAAKGFAAEGARVIIVGRNRETLASARAEIGEGTIALQADLSSKPAVDDLVAQVTARTGRLDAIFVNAGISIFGPLASVSEDDWDQLMNINLKCAFFLTQGLLPLMGRGGAVVLCGSVGGLRVRPAAGVYGTSKAALGFLARALAAELVEAGIRVNIVVPGPIDTPLPNRSGIPEEAVDEVKEMMRLSSPMKRFGTAEECASAALFLASREAGYITGEQIVVDGGVFGCT